MKPALRLALMSVWLGACGGDDQPAALADFDDADRPRSSQSTGGSGNGSSSSTETGPGGGTQAGATQTGGGGDTGSYIPTPIETGPMETNPMNMAGAAGSSSNPAFDPCTLGTWTGDFSARSSAELQGLTGYSHVTGTLYVGVSSSATTTDVTSLSALTCLEQVDGSVTILENGNLTKLDGLERLAFVGDDFTISTNARLRTLEALSELVVTDILHIRANPQLTTLGDGILSAATLYVTENAALPQCQADELAEQLGLTCGCSENSESCP